MRIWVLLVSLFIFLIANDITLAIPKFTDVGDDSEFAISDIDFTNIPLGLMPDQSCESLYLIIQ